MQYPIEAGAMKESHSVLRRVAILFILAVLFSVGPLAVAQTTLEAYLYNPGTNQIVLKYPYQRDSETFALKPTLVLRGDGLPDGDGRLHYALEAHGKTLLRGEVGVRIRHGRLGFEIELKRSFPTAQRVVWSIAGMATGSLHGSSALSWSRFHGRVRYRSGAWRSTYIELVPVHFGRHDTIMVPVAGDGTFDALVPARVYAVVNVNGAGYQYDAMERWAWNYDLRRDREDLFNIGSTEIYGARAFEVLGGPAGMFFVFFRPSSLGRIHRFDLDGDGILNDEENRAQWSAMKDSPTAIGPELTADDVKVLLDGKPVKILRLDRIPEANGDGHWQVDYLLQCFIPTEAEAAKPGVWSREVKIQVESHEVLRGKEVTDFGEGSVDILWE
jgi:hypothetical protein